MTNPVTAAVSTETRPCTNYGRGRSACGTPAVGLLLVMTTEDVDDALEAFDPDRDYPRTTVFPLCEQHAWAGAPPAGLTWAPGWTEQPAGMAWAPAGDGLRAWWPL